MTVDTQSTRPSEPTDRRQKTLNFQLSTLNSQLFSMLHPDFTPTCQNVLIVDRW
ncbi:MAG: hypothetical protein ACRC62_19970 [Microcoleus sp.]